MGEKNQVYHVKGMVVLTGELQARGLSSNLRCLYCEMEREKANVEMVTWFQTNKYAYTTLIEHFTRFLSMEWENIVFLIRNNIESKRRMAEKYLTERRLVDTLATLWIMAEIIGQFFVKYCGMLKDNVLSEISIIQSEIKTDYTGYVYREKQEKEACTGERTGDGQTISTL